MAGQFGGWTPIGAEQTASGYQVAWKVPGADQYSVWTTDSNGNFTSTSAILSASSSALQSFETSFHQDLNGDGAIGVPGTVIELAGSTSLVAVGTMDGTNISGGAALLNPGPTWHVEAAADFNGDGKSDILWQHDNGTPAIWIMDGTNLSRGAALPNPGPAWHIAEAADFNGDGNSDILSQHDSGAPAIWTMDGTNIIDAAVLPNPGSDWHII